MLRYLARQPATARRICTKLAQYFVSETPSTTLVDSLVATYLAGDTAIAPVLRKMFTSAEFTAQHRCRDPAAPRVVGRDGPAARVWASTHSGYDGVQALVYQLGDAGQSPMNWPTPDGFPIPSAAWGSTNATLSRWNFIRSIVNGWWPNSLTRTATLLAWVHPGALARRPTASWSTTSRCGCSDARCPPTTRPRP